MSRPGGHSTLSGSPLGLQLKPTELQPHGESQDSSPPCPWCEDGWIIRVRACPCRAPEKMSDEEAREHYENATHDPRCRGGWIEFREPCECQAQ